ncbi:MAG: hypothetical protein IJI44_07385 [Erysipelotrichaceae bacterium]|nr:hypothetical protein [Erysipelotrichaceae bacterium]
MKLKEKEFKIHSGNRPRVLLLGNGLNRSFGGVSWDGLLDEIKDKESFRSDACNYLMPMPLKAVMLTKNKLAEKMAEVVEEADRKNADKSRKIAWDSFSKTNHELRSKINLLINGNFDYVLTTNYGYEIETSLLDLDGIKPKQIQKLMNFYEVDNAQKQFLLNTFNLVNDIPIWHIHGEARKPGSMILGNFYYGKNLRRCVERLDGSLDRKINGKIVEFRKNMKDRKPQKIGSWVDAFILGDVYVLGLGLDFSESDIWWLIECKCNNKDISGTTTLYEPVTVHKNMCILDKDRECDIPSEFAVEKQCRDMLLKEVYGVHIDSLGITINDTEDYRVFYNRVIDKMLENRE